MSDIDYRNTPDFKKGHDVFFEKHPPSNKKMIEEMYQLSPELTDVIIAHGTYDIWVRKTPNLTVIEKEIASLTALIEQQNQAEIKAHIITCLNVGVTKQRIIELLIFLTLYSGVPKIVIAYRCLKEALDEFDRLTKQGKKS